MLEAMAVARPVVAALVGAIPEIVVDGETGRLVAPAPDPVAAGLESVLGDSGARAPVRRGRTAPRGGALHARSRRAALVEGVYARTLTKEALPRR